MRVVVNLTAALGKRTGVGHYASELFRGLREMAGPEQIDEFPRGWVRSLGDLWYRARPRLQASAGHRPQPESAEPSPRADWSRRLMGSLRRGGRRLLIRHFRAACRRQGYDLYHEPNFIPLPGDVPAVVTLHDLSVILHPQWHPADRVAFFERYFATGLADCAHVLAVSEYGRQEIIRTLNLPPDKVTRTYNGIRRGLAPLPRERVAATLRALGLPGRYLLYLGTLEPRKNVALLLRAYCALPDSLRRQWPLVLVGGWGWRTGEIAALLHDEARHRGVLHVGYVAEEHLAALYNGARALVYPSLYEGFGLPPVEMMACGGAVLASTAGAVVETVGGRAHLIHPGDLGGWRDAMARVVQDEEWWQGLRDGVADMARAYTWERCAAETYQVYQKVCGIRAEPRARPLAA